jgi:hypothetical protein
MGIDSCASPRGQVAIISVGGQVGQQLIDSDDCRLARPGIRPSTIWKTPKIGRTVSPFNFVDWLFEQLQQLFLETLGDRLQRTHSRVPDLQQGI